MSYLNNKLTIFDLEVSFGFLYWRYWLKEQKLSIGLLKWLLGLINDLLTFERVQLPLISNTPCPHSDHHKLHSEKCQTVKKKELYLHFPASQLWKLRLNIDTSSCGILCKPSKHLEYVPQFPSKRGNHWGR